MDLYRFVFFILLSLLNSLFNSRNVLKKQGREVIVLSHAVESNCYSVQEFFFGVFFALSFENIFCNSFMIVLSFNLLLIFLIANRNIHQPPMKINQSLPFFIILNKIIQLLILVILRAWQSPYIRQLLLSNSLKLKPSQHSLELLPITLQ